MGDFRFPFNVLEVTGRNFFDGENLVERRFADVQEEVAEIFEIPGGAKEATRESSKENE
jgi:hypothetical protein